MREFWNIQAIEGICLNSVAIESKIRNLKNAPPVDTTNKLEELIRNKKKLTEELNFLIKKNA
jgi:hypothetical protein